MKTLDQKMRTIGSARRKKVNARASALIAEEVTPQELRQARKLTQVRMAKTLGISQDGIRTGDSNFRCSEIIRKKT